MESGRPKDKLNLLFIFAIGDMMIILQIYKINRKETMQVGEWRMDKDIKPFHMKSFGRE